MQWLEKKMLQLNNLTPLVKKRKRVGRGGSRGGTSGKGHKGQKARSGGYVRAGFEGGQMPLFRRSPKSGFTNANFKKEVEVINLEQINAFFEDGAHVDREALVQKGLLKTKNSAQGAARMLKILGKGDLAKKVTITADAFSASAVSAIEKLGGKVQLTKEK
jgi:large subunit ribosomal protein L15